MTKARRLSLFWKILGAGLLLFLGAAAVGLYQLQKRAPALLQDYFVRTFEDTCSTCRLKIGAVKLSLVRGPIVFEKISMQVGKPEITQYNFDAEQVVAFIDPYSLLDGQINLGKIEIEAPRVIIVDGDEHSPKKRKDNVGQEKPTRFAIKQILVRNGFFSYIRNEKGVKAQIKVRDIQATIGALGTAGALHDELTEGRALAVLENSGQADVTIQSYIFRRPFWVDVDIKLRRQNLEDLNAYFDKSDGISLKGYLHQGTGHVAVRGDHLTSTVYAKYTGLKVKFRHNRDRTPFEAFLMRMMGNLLIDPSNKNEPYFQQTQTVTMQREKGSLVRFILHGLKGAAFKIAQDVRPLEKAR